MYSNTEVKHAGQSIRDTDGKPDELSLAILDYWRSSHESSIAIAYDFLYEHSQFVDKSSYTSSRPKRLESIIYKLKRFTNMSLATMYDIGGCRAVLLNSNCLDQLYERLVSLDDFDKRDIKDYRKGKPDGYRGIHLVKKIEYENLKHRKIELQIRTRMQHCWATTVEVIDLLTGQNLKGGNGDSKWKSFFLNVTVIFDLIDKIDNFHFCYSDEQEAAFKTVILGCPEALAAAKIIKGLMSIDEIKSQFNKAVSFLSETNREKIERFVHSKNYRYLVVVVDLENRDISVFKDCEIDSLIDLEKENFGKNKKIALLMSNAVEGILEAYPSFLLNIDMFMDYMKYIEGIDVDSEIFQVSESVAIADNFWCLIFDQLNFNSFPKDMVFSDPNKILTTSTQDISWDEYLVKAGVFDRESADRIAYGDFFELYVDNISSYIPQDKLEEYEAYISRIKKSFEDLQSLTYDRKLSMIRSFIENDQLG